MPVTILVSIVVILSSGSPVKHAQVEVEGMIWDSFNGEAITGADGKFIVEVEPGIHVVGIWKDHIHLFHGSIEFTTQTKKIIITVEDKKE